MENAADALKIGFALLVFATAVAIVFTMISRVKATADTVLYYADDTNYHEHNEANAENRLVGKEEVISTLYRYYKESICVTVNLNGIQYIFNKGNEKWGDTKLNLNTEKQIEEKLAEFIETKLNTSSGVFKEQFVEAPTGKYFVGDDGSEVELSSGIKKIYIIYSEE